MENQNQLTTTNKLQERSLSIMDPSTMDQMQRIAKIMSASSFCPVHLKGRNEAETIANCFKVIQRSYRWRMDPFGVADSTYAIGGRLGYEGKLIAAVVNTSDKVATNLNFSYSGEGMDRTCTVIGRLACETDERTVEIVYRDAARKDKGGSIKAIWTQDVDQKLAYSGAIKWARRHTPELILGVKMDDEVQQIYEDDTADQPMPPTNLDELAERLTGETKTIFVSRDDEVQQIAEPVEVISSTVREVEAVGPRLRPALQPGEIDPMVDSLALEFLDIELKEATTIKRCNEIKETRMAEASDAEALELNAAVHERIEQLRNAKSLR